MSAPELKLDLLFSIFEKHLYDFNDEEENSEKFVDKIVGDYVSQLTQNGVVLPRRWKAHIVDELRDQVRKMLVRKMYGCLSIQDYINGERHRSRKQKAS